jgi:N-methylhydantoinase B
MTDAVTLQIIRGKLEALAREMGVVLARSAMSPVIYEVYDFGCGISDAKGRLIAGSHGVAAFSALFGPQITAIKEKYGAAITPGDVYITNDPYLGGSHLNDVLLVVPIFEEGELIAFANSYAHWTEVGGMTPGSLSPSAEEIYQEGIRFPIMRLFKAGERQDELLELIAANVRLPKMSLGDLNAQIAALRIGEVRLREAVTKYGCPAVLATFDHVLETSERLARAAVSALPDGVYKAEDFIDGDGFSETQFPVRMQMTIAGDEITFDFAGSCDQLRGPMKGSLEMLLCGVKVVFKAIVDPHGPSNEGWYRPIRVKAPEGSVFNARAPAALGWFYEPMAQGAELVWKAMAPLVPDRLTAGSYMSICVVLMGAKRPGTGEQFVHIEASAGGFGAAAGADGTSVRPAAPQGDLYNYSLEPLEARAPLRMHRYALNTADGAGAGRWRGGFGAIREYEILGDDAFVYGGMGRNTEPPWGIDGGGAGSCNGYEIVRNGEAVRHGRTQIGDLARGDRVRIVTGGGGGVGDPFTRPPECVRDDVLDGYITADAARAHYGVVIDPNGTIDIAATNADRQERAKDGPARR